MPLDMHWSLGYWCKINLQRNLFDWNKSQNEHVMCHLHIFNFFCCSSWVNLNVMRQWFALPCILLICYSITQHWKCKFGSNSSNQKSNLLDLTAIVFDCLPTQTSEWQEMREASMCHYVVFNHTDSLWSLLPSYCKAYRDLGVINVVVIEALALMVIFIPQSLCATSKAPGRSRTVSS